MIYGSVCSGIEAATVAWHPLGWIPEWFSEIEPFPCRLLQHYYPAVPNLGDMLKLHEKETFNESNIDLLVGGTPCQSFSIAGLRAGLASPNGNLALQFCRILTIKRPRWFVWENVPGVHSSYSYEEGSERVDGEGQRDGREFTETADFASIIAGFQECGYSIAWRVLDAQFFGVPQRRRRVFVVGYLGDDWRPPAAVLFEPEGMRGNPPPGRKEGQEITGALGRRTSGRSIGAEEAADGQLIVGTIDASYGRLQGASGQDAGHGHSTLVTSSMIETGAKVWSIMPMNSCKDYKARLVDVTQPITTQQGISNNGGDIVQQFPQGFQSSQSGVRLVDTHATLDANNGPRRHNGIITGSIVRRLTPLECERLQGFPDNYTNIPVAADSPRYEAIGNSMAVPVMHWLGKRIDMVDQLIKK